MDWNQDRQKKFENRYGMDNIFAKDSGPPVELEIKEKKFKVTYKAHPEVLEMKFDTAEEWRKQNEIKIIGKNSANPILNFSHTPFPKDVIHNLEKEYSTPSPIQSQSWPIVLSGKDMVGSAKTGSGKTLAFILPGLEHIKDQEKPNTANPVALVLAPTRELTQQIEQEANRFKQFYNVKTACVFGGQGNRLSQLNALQKQPQLVVAAPGRLLDFALEGIVSLKNISYLVLDEADRMLDMGFEPQIRNIVSRIAVGRQTLMFSATWPNAVQALCHDYLQDPTRVNIGSLRLSANPDIKQEFIFLLRR